MGYDEDGRDLEKLSTTILRYRSRNKMTQEDLGLAIGVPSKSAKSYICQIEAGTKMPSLERAISLAKALNAPIEVFLMHTMQWHLNEALKASKHREDFNLYLMGDVKTLSGNQGDLLDNYWIIRQYLIAALLSGKVAFFTQILSQFLKTYANERDMRDLGLTSQAIKQMLDETRAKRPSLKTICRVFEYLGGIDNLTNKRKLKGVRMRSLAPDFLERLKKKSEST